MERLSGVIQAYDWGDPEALAHMLGHTPPGHPEAEYWLGTHPGGPGLLQPDEVSLAEAIADRPGELLGSEVADRFGDLPYLMKILAVARPLSIQAHPSTAQAVAGFEREEGAGVPRDAPNRSYRDARHKPEIICALSPFEARCGLRDPERSAEMLDILGDGLAPVQHRLARCGPAETAAHLLRLPAEEGASLAETAVEAARALVAGCGGDSDDLDDPCRAELESIVTVGHAFPGDVGAVVTLLMNHVKLAPGQALFLPAGNLHAYLRGVGVEAMANSDNVLRGGLTPKHIDVDELMKVLDRRWGPVEIQTPASAAHTYRTPVPDLSLTRFVGPPEPDTPNPRVLASAGPEIFLVTAGQVELVSADQRSTLLLGKGQAAFVPPTDGPYRMTDMGPGHLTAWRVTVGELR